MEVILVPEEHDPDLETTHQTPVGESPELVAGRYRIVRTLGRGGGGIVWLARDEHLGREVALKRVAGEADTEILVTRGLREARTSAALAHDHVVTVYDAFEHDGAPWIVMEYVPGPSLSALLEGGRSLPVRQVARIGAQVATALAAAHGAGVVHRDVKPGNVLLTDDSGQDAKLTDFGIARAEDDHQLTRTGMVSGTAAYFSPELARGDDPSAASDVWALGATLYAAVEGRRPFPDAGNAVAQLHLIAREAPDAPRRAGPLEPVLRGLLDPDPQTRWTADRAARALAEVAQGRPAEQAAAGAVGAGAAAVAAAAAARTWTRDDHDDSTQMVPGADTTRRVPVGPGGDAQGARSRPDGRTADHAYAARARSAREPGRATYTGAGTAPRGQGPGRRRRGRGPVLLGWLVGIPLAVLLGWLVWTIATGDRPGPDEDAPTATATQDQPVSAEEAEATVRAFYTDLQEQGLEAARRHMVDGVPVDDGIAVDLTSIDVTIEDSQEVGDGAEVVAVAAYTYGETRVITQRETMQVARRGTEALIVQRVTQTMSDTGAGQDGGNGDSSGEGEGGDGTPADENGGEGQDGGNDNSGPGNSDQDGGNDNSGPGNSDQGGSGNQGGGSDGAGSTAGPGNG